jgi:hypothetical protein
MEGFAFLPQILRAATSCYCIQSRKALSVCPATLIPAFVVMRILGITENVTHTLPTSPNLFIYAFQPWAFPGPYTTVWK